MYPLYHAATACACPFGALDCQRAVVADNVCIAHMKLRHEITSTSGKHLTPEGSNCDVS